jgi:hypothetical protein
MFRLWANPMESSAPVIELFSVDAKPSRRPGDRGLRCRRLLKPRGIYLSSDLGPLSQNPVLALVTPLSRGKKVEPSTS